MQDEDDTANSEERDSQSSENEELCRRLKKEFRKDAKHWSKWREAARMDYKLYAGDQWDDEAKRTLEDQGRPAPSFNRIQTTIKTVAGYEIGNRQEIRFLPREMGDVQVNELVTSACKWYRDQADAEDEESDAFTDALICGLGWLETRLDHEADPDGKPCEDRTDPLEMLADRYSKKPNLVDAKRLWRVRKIARDDAEAMFPDAEPHKLNAGWATSFFDLDGDEDEIHNADKQVAYDDDDGGEDGDTTTDEVTIVECQYAEREAFYRVTDPFSGQVQSLAPKDHKVAMGRLKELGVPDGVVQSVKQTRLVRYRCFIGSEILEKTPTPCPKHFTYQAITGLRDQASGTWFGLVRPMTDPQQWLNKFFSQILHMVNTTAKGGIMAELGTFEDQREAETSWAKQDAITWVRPGKMDKILPKPQTAFPGGIWQMMQFALDFVPKASGVNEEMIGIRDANQPGVLEAHRKQAGMTVLGSFFDSLRRARKNIGEIILYIIQNDIPDGRMIRIVGDDKKQNVPLMKKQTAGEYDIIVEEAPTSPNEKERTWGLIQGIMASLPPQVQMKLIKYSPLPEAAIEEITQAAQEAMQPPDPSQDPKVMEGQAKLQLAQQEAQLKGQLAQQEFEAEQGRENMRLQMDMQREREKANLEREKMQFTHSLEMEKLQRQSDIDTQRVAHEQAISTGKAEAGVKAAQSSPEFQAIVGPTHEALIALHQTMADLGRHLTAPKRVVRDETGRAIGVEHVVN